MVFLVWQQLEYGNFFLGDVSLGSCSVDFVKSLLIREVQEFLVLRAQSGLSPTYPST